MAEICGAPNCPIADKVSRLEDQLDEFQTQNGDSHREIYGRLNALEKSSAVTDVHYKSIMAKLDALSSDVMNLNNKPAKRWEAVVSALIGAVVSGLVVYLMMRVGLG